MNANYGARAGFLLFLVGCDKIFCTDIGSAELHEHLVAPQLLVRLRAKWLYEQARGAGAVPPMAKHAGIFPPDIPELPRYL